MWQLQEINIGIERLSGSSTLFDNLNSLRSPTKLTGRSSRIPGTHLTNCRFQSHAFWCLEGLTHLPAPASGSTTGWDGFNGNSCNSAVRANLSSSLHSTGRRLPGWKFLTSHEPGNRFSGISRSPWNTRSDGSTTRPRRRQGGVLESVDLIRSSFSVYCGGGWMVLHRLNTQSGSD